MMSLSPPLFNTILALLRAQCKSTCLRAQSVLTTNVTWSHHRCNQELRLSPGAERKGLFSLELTPTPPQQSVHKYLLCLRETLLSPGMAAHLATAGRGLCLTLCPQQALVEMKVLVPTPSCAGGTEKLFAGGRKGTQGSGCWSEGALLKAGDSGVPQWL